MLLCLGYFFQITVNTYKILCDKAPCHEDVDMKLSAYLNLTINRGKCYVLKTNYFTSKKDTWVSDNSVGHIKSWSEYYCKENNSCSC
jgi:hypothetical protein